MLRPAAAARPTLRINRSTITAPQARDQYRGAYMRMMRQPHSELFASIETRRKAADDYGYLLSAIADHKQYRLLVPANKTTYREYIKKSSLRCGLVPPKFWDEDPQLPQNLKPKTTERKQIFEFQER